MKIDKLMAARDVTDETNKLWVYIHLNETKNPADPQYFCQRGGKGGSLIKGYDIRTLSKTNKSCYTKFADYVASGNWELVEPGENCQEYLEITDKIRNFISECK